VTYTGSADRTRALGATDASSERQRLSTHFHRTVEGAKAQELAHFHRTGLRIFTRRGDGIAAAQTPDSGGFL